MFGKKSNLRMLIDSISKDDFNSFKVAVEQKTKDNDIVKKLYEKLMGHPIPENDRGVIIKIESDVLSAYELCVDGKKRYPVVISEYRDYDGKVETQMSVDACDELIMELIRPYVTHFVYRNYQDVEPYVIENDYIEAKAIKYGVGLDNETYYKLRLLVESLQ